MPPQSTRTHAQAHNSSKSTRQSVTGIGDTDCLALRTDRQTRQGRSDSSGAARTDQGCRPLPKRFSGSLQCFCQAPHPWGDPSLPPRQRWFSASASTRTRACSEVAQAAGPNRTVPSTPSQPLRPAACRGLPPTWRMETAERKRTPNNPSNRWLDSQRDRSRGTRPSDKEVLATPAGHGTTLCSSRRSRRTEFAGHRSVAGDQRDDRATKGENGLKHPVQTMQERGTLDLKALSPSLCRARSGLQEC